MTLTDFWHYFFPPKPETAPPLHEHEQRLALKAELDAWYAEKGCGFANEFSLISYRWSQPPSSRWACKFWTPDHDCHGCGAYPLEAFESARKAALDADIDLDAIPQVSMSLHVTNPDPEHLEQARHLKAGLSQWYAARQKTAAFDVTFCEYWQCKLPVTHRRQKTLVVARGSGATPFAAYEAARQRAEGYSDDVPTID